MTMRPAVACALVFATGACGAADPIGVAAKLPTVLVTNATCGAGHCETLNIRAFVSKFAVPGQPPHGAEVLGEAPPGQTCLTFPPSWSLRITGADNTGRAGTTTITWTPEDTFPISLIAVNHGDDGFAGSVGDTRDFVPGAAPGWSVSFPSGPGSARLASGAVCTP